jgi:translation initiation factor 1A
MRTGSNSRMKLPYKPRGELMGIVREVSGGSRLIAFCEDNMTRMVRIGGKLKKKMWTRVGDLVIIKKWQIQEDKKSDLVYRYTKTEKESLRRKGLIPEVLDIL